MLRNGTSGGAFRAFGLCLALAAGAPAAAADAEPAPASYERVRLAVAHLGRAGFQGEQAAVQWLGTAFLVDERCTVVTAKHAIDGIPEGRLVLRFREDAEDRTRTYPARVLHVPEDSDLAFLTFGPERPSKRFCGSDAFTWLPPRADSAGLTGAEVRIFGFPAIEGGPPRGVPIVRAGLVASAELTWREAPMLLLDLTGVPGFSGAPVVLETTGEVVGVVYGPGRTERVFDLEWATPLTGADYRKALEKGR